MAAPTFVAEYETAWTNASPKTTSSITVAAGDVLVVLAVTEDTSNTFGTPTNSGTAQTWTLAQQVTNPNYTRVAAWTAVMSTAQTLTVSLTRSGSGDFGFNVLHFTGSDGPGASNKANGNGGAPQVSVTTTQANSALVGASGDWNATDGATRTWLSINGSAITEQSYYRDPIRYVAYVGRHADVGAAGAKTYGLSAPSGQKFSIVAVEVKGTTGGGGTDGSVTAVAATATATAVPPTVSTTGGANVAAVAASATAEAVAPTVAAESVVDGGGPATATATAHPPTVTAGASVTAVAATATAAVVPPAVSASGAATVQAVAATATATGQAPAVTAGATVTAPAATATGQAHAPSVAAGGSVTIAAPAATATAQTAAPQVSASSSVQAVAATATASITAATVSASATIEALVALATAQALAPFVGDLGERVDITVDVGPTRVGTVTVDATRHGTVTVDATRAGSVTVGDTRLGTLEVGPTRRDRGE